MLIHNFMITYFRKKSMNKFNKLQPKNIIKLFLGIIPIFILAITFSCEEDPSKLGADLLPDSDKIDILYDTTLTFNSYVFENKAVATSNLSSYPIGIIDDEYFGMFNSEYAGQFLPAVLVNSINVDSIISIDSAILYLDIDGVYGSLESNLKFNVYELNTEIEDSSNHVYYSDEDISNFYSSTDLINTDSKICGDSLVIIPLNSTFSDKFISNGDTINKTSVYFKSIFKGISIIPDTYTSQGCLLTTNISSYDTKIVLYYKTNSDDSLSLTYQLKNGYRFGEYTTDYSTGKISDFLNNAPNINDSLLFFQGCNGVSSKITFSDYTETFSPDSSYSILNTELTIPVFKDDNFEHFPPPEKLYFYYSDADSNLIPVEDYGYYDDSKSLYSFNISKHLMNFLNGNIEDSCLNIGMSNKSINPDRVILKSGENIKLKVTYTKH